MKWLIVVFGMVLLFIWKVPKQKYWVLLGSLCERVRSLGANWLGACLVRKRAHWVYLKFWLAQQVGARSSHSIMFCLENGSVWSVIVRMASGLSYLKFSLGGWARIPSCVSMYVLACNALSTRKKRKRLRAGSKLHDYFLRSVPLHDYFLQSVN